MHWIHHWYELFDKRLLYSKTVHAITKQFCAVAKAWIISAAGCILPCDKVEVIAGVHDMEASEHTRQNRTVPNCEDIVRAKKPDRLALFKVQPFNFNGRCGALLNLLVIQESPLFTTGSALPGV